MKQHGQFLRTRNLETTLINLQNVLELLKFESLFLSPGCKIGLFPLCAVYHAASKWHCFLPEKRELILAIRTIDHI